MKPLLKFFIPALLLTSAFSVNAVTIAPPSTMSMDPGVQGGGSGIDVGELLTFDVLYDFGADNTIGGAFSVNFNDIAFDFVGFAFDASLSDDPAFRVLPASGDDSPFELGFANFSGFTGSGTVGTLTFQAIGEGTFSFTLGDPVVNDGFQGLSSAPTYGSSQITVNAVPLPGAVWLLMSGIAGLGVLKQRKHVG